MFDKHALRNVILLYTSLLFIGAVLDYVLKLENRWTVVFIQFTVGMIILRFFPIFNFNKKSGDNNEKR